MVFKISSMTIVDCLILFPWVLTAALASNIMFHLWFEKKPQRLIYAVDITLRGAEETLDDFIMRAYNEHLGEYRIV
jgi:hypothetical protein